MTIPGTRFYALSEGQRRMVHELLAEHALTRWNAYVERQGAIRYREAVCGTELIVDTSLPEDALAAVRSGEGIAGVDERYREPLVALHEHDLSLPKAVEFAYYAIHNFFRKYALRDEIDDWLLVSQALSSEVDVEKGKAVLRQAIERAI